MKKSRIIWIVLGVMLFLSMSGVSATYDRSDLKRLSPMQFMSYMNKRIPEIMKKEKIPGAALVLVRKGRVLQIRGYGYRDKAKKLPVTTDTVFQVGSISKPMTAWGIMKLVQDGCIKLDYPLETYLFHWRLPKSDYDHKQVTPRRLLSHTAGISVQKYPGYHPNKDLPTLEDLLAGKGLGLEKVCVQQEPGSGLMYSQGGYTLLQFLVEEVTREDFSTYLEREIIQPLGLKSTSYQWRHDLRGRTARGYDIYGFALPNYLFTAKAATGLYSTPADLSRWMIGTNQAFLGQSQAVLNRISCQTLFTPVLEDSGLGYQVQSLPFGEKYVSQ